MWHFSLFSVKLPTSPYRSMCIVYWSARVKVNWLSHPAEHPKHNKHKYEEKKRWGNHWDLFNKPCGDHRLLNYPGSQSDLVDSINIIVAHTRFLIVQWRSKHTDYLKQNKASKRRISNLRSQFKGLKRPTAWYCQVQAPCSVARVYHSS